MIKIINDTQTWYIVKRDTGHCEIVSSNEATGDDHPQIIEQWGLFTSEGEAIARRVGLIKSGKWQPL